MLNGSKYNARYVVSFLSLLVCLVAGANERKLNDKDIELEKLRQQYVNAKNDEEKLKALDELAYEHYNLDSTYHYSLLMLDLARKVRNPECEIHALRYVAWSHYNYCDYLSSLRYSLDALAIADSIHSDKFVARLYSDLGNSFCMLNNFSKANSYYGLSMEMLKQQKDYVYLSDVYRNVASSSLEAGNYALADSFYYEALKLDVSCDFSDRISNDYLGMGGAAYDRYSIDYYTNPNDSLLNVAKKYFLLAYNSSKQRYNYICLYSSGYSLASTMLMQVSRNMCPKNRVPEVLDSCRVFIDESRKLVQRHGYESEMFSIDLVEAQRMIVENKYQRALFMLDSLSVRMEEDGVPYREGKNHLLLNYVECYRRMGDYKKAFDYMAQVRVVSDGLNRVDLAVEVAQGLAQSEFDKKLKAREVEENKREASLKIHYRAMGIVFLLLLVIIIQIVISSRKRRKAYAQIDAKNVELKEQQVHIEKQNRELERRNEQMTATNNELTSSINYASYIQKAVMPSESVMQEIWGQSVVALRPLKVVSGDFYWTTVIGTVKVLVVGDCTGHGVPGAFLSMLGMQTLEYLSPKLIKEGCEPNAGQFLDEMRKMVKVSLHKNMAGNTLDINMRDGASFEVDDRDGMDLAVIMLDTQTMKMHYAGALRPLVVIRDGKELTWPCDRMPIGDSVMDNVPFTDHEIMMQKGDSVYLYTDGITDQFGYDENMRIVKYGTKRLYKLLTSICDMPTNEQKKRIGIEFAYWRMGGVEESNNLYEQTDDALLVGVKL